MIARLAAALCLAVLAAGDVAAKPAAGPGTLPLSYEVAADFALERTDMLVVEGHAESPADGSGAVTLVLRIDDDHSAGYASRVNLERAVKPGPFRWELPVSGLRTTDGRALRIESVKRIILFRIGTAKVTARLAAEPAPTLPAGAAGYSFGAPDAPLPAGFERVAPGDPKLAGTHAIPVRRPGVDPLLASGMRDLRSIRLPAPDGPARVTLWTEDVGEWELLPHPLRRRIAVSGTVVRDETLTPAAWIAGRYLAGRDVEWRPGEDAWSLYGSRRGGRISVETVVVDGAISIELSGDGPAGAFLAAVLIEPGSGDRPALAEVEARRAAWHRAAWTVGPEAPDPALRIVDLDTRPATEPIRLAGARGTTVHASFAVKSRSERHAAVSAHWPDRGFPAAVYAAQLRLERRDVGRNLLVPAEDILRRDNATLPIRADRPRRYELVVHIPADAKPGRIAGELRIVDAGAERRIGTVEIEVLAAVLPPAPAPVGFYLDEPPHAAWFGGDPKARSVQLACDLATLRRFGLTGNAPALSTPTIRGMDGFIADSRLAAAAGTSAPWLAYAPFKRAVSAMGLAGAAAQLAEAERRGGAVDLPRPVWSIADEPSNHDRAGGPSPADIAAAVRAVAPGALLAGQLNDPGDIRHAHLFDVAIINPGFGIDSPQVETLRKAGRRVWLYNAGRPRLAAGYWTHLTGAERYLQWHARMPTADPFDPTDGREGDVQVFMPTAEPCSGPDIHRDLLRLADGAVDQRWLAWLASRNEPEAAALRRDLNWRFGKSWATAAAIPEAELDRMRSDIMDLARRLN